MIIISWYLLFHDNMRISIFISECLVSRKNREKVKRWKWALLGFPRPSYSLPPWSLLIVHHHNLNQNHHHHDHHDHHDHHQGWTPTVESRSSSVNISSILNNFQVGYDRRVRPNYGEVVITKGGQEHFQVEFLSPLVSPCSSSPLEISRKSSWTSPSTCISDRLTLYTMLLSYNWQSLQCRPGWIHGWPLKSTQT